MSFHHTEMEHVDGILSREWLNDKGSFVVNTQYYGNWLALNGVPLCLDRHAKSHVI